MEIMHDTFLEVEDLVNLSGKLESINLQVISGKTHFEFRVISCIRIYHGNLCCSGSEGYFTTPVENIERIVAAALFIKTIKIDLKGGVI